MTLVGVFANFSNSVVALTCSSSLANLDTNTSAHTKTQSMIVSVANSSEKSSVISIAFIARQVFLDIRRELDKSAHNTHKKKHGETDLHKGHSDFPSRAFWMHPEQNTCPQSARFGFTCRTLKSQKTKIRGRLEQHSRKHPDRLRKSEIS